MIRKIYRLLPAVMAVFALAACNNAMEVDDGYGCIGVSMDRDVTLETKADGYPELDDDYEVTIVIYEGDEMVVKPTTEMYGALKEARYKVPTGTYRVVASTGTNQAAAWDSPFYCGEDEVTVYADRDNMADIICTLANVKVTVSFDEVFDMYFTSYQVHVDNGMGEGLTFSSDLNTLDREGYFSVTGTLTWKLTLVNNDGDTYVMSDTISDVKARQHYPLVFKLSEEEPEQVGDAVFKVAVDDSINEKEYNPVLDFSEKGDMSVETSGFDNTNVINVPQGDLNTKTITKKVEDGVSSFLVGVDRWYELVNAAPATLAALEAMGIEAESVNPGATEVTIDITRYIASLSLGAYVLNVSAYDMKGQASVSEFNFNIMSNVEADVVSVRAYADAAVFEGKWFADQRPSGIGFEYAPLADTTSWIKVDQSALVFDDQSKRYTAVVAMEPSTAYTFRPYTDNEKYLRKMDYKTPVAFTVTSVAPWAEFAVIKGTWNTMNQPESLSFVLAGGAAERTYAASRPVFEGNAFAADICGIDPNTTYTLSAVKSSTSMTSFNEVFMTEGNGVIYNLSFDDWYQDGNVWYPYAQGASVPTWDSANKAAATFVGSSTTPGEGADAYSGRSARLESKYAVIAFAAGNLYTGKFGGINGKGATLEWGVPFSSRPVALKGYYKYSPKVIDRTDSGMASYKGKMDRAQITMCLAEGWTAPFPINTTEGKFVDFSGSDIMAFGRLESDVEYTDFQEFVIPLEYRDNAAVPSYVVISAAASYLGDYFTGGEGSVLVVDEFSFIYDVAELTDEQAAKVNYR